MERACRLLLLTRILSYGRKKGVGYELLIYTKDTYFDIVSLTVSEQYMLIVLETLFITIS